MSVTSATWQVELDLFRGPLHVLLDLIERRELPITEISLVAVTDQYLSLVRASPAFDLDLTAEFLHVAARLLLLKSIALLPRSTPDGPRDDEGDDDLEARLTTYRRFRDAARLLAARQEAGQRLFGRSGPLDVPTPLPRGVEIDAARLRRAARRAGERLAAAERARAAAPGPLIPFTTVLRAVIERLRGRRHVHFGDIAAEADDVIVAITMFLAVLELVRRRRLAIHQSVPFGPIELIPDESLGAVHGTTVPIEPVSS